MKWFNEVINPLELMLFLSLRHRDWDIEGVQVCSGYFAYLPLSKVSICC